jgi:hypothetical protein
MKNKDFHQQHAVGKWIAGSLILFLIARNVYNGFDGEPVSDLIPLQLCHLAAWLIVPGAIFFRNKYLSLIAITLSLPTAYLSLIFLHYDNLFEPQAICYLILHALIVIGCIYLIFIYHPIFDFRYFMKSVGYLVAYFLVTIVINNLFINNGVPSYYLYSVIPEPGTPLETFYNWGTNYHIIGLTINPIYNLLVISIAVLVMFLIFKIYTSFSKKTKNITYWDK